IVVVAEGDEHEAHDDHIRSVGCDLLQGYAISRPVPADELEQFLDGWRWIPGDERDAASSSVAPPGAG
ncbi:MAG TPA: hypothetical protein VK866_17390, partial [Acidimicrobiales bacterium]|nr:hypothetical protein [Acidimicrobiales bacterium]